MTAEKAIEHLENIAIFSSQDGYTDEARKALDMAIKALKAQDVPDTNVGDMVSRQAVIDFINGITNMDLKVKGSLVLGIKFMPAVKQEPCNDAVSRKALLHIFEEQCYPVHYDHNSVDVGMTLPGIVEVLNIAPSAQPEPCEYYAARLKFCEYCNEDSDGYVRPIEKNNHAFVRFGMNGWELEMKANGWHGSAKIRYCPMCGRDLFVK